MYTDIIITYYCSCMLIGRDDKFHDFKGVGISEKMTMAVKFKKSCGEL